MLPLPTCFLDRTALMISLICAAVIIILVITIINRKNSIINIFVISGRLCIVECPLPTALWLGDNTHHHSFRPYKITYSSPPILINCRVLPLPGCDDSTDTSYVPRLSVVKLNSVSTNSDPECPLLKFTEVALFGWQGPPWNLHKYTNDNVSPVLSLIFLNLINDRLAMLIVATTARCINYSGIEADTPSICRESKCLNLFRSKCCSTYVVNNNYYSMHHCICMRCCMGRTLQEHTSGVPLCGTALVCL